MRERDRERKDLNDVNKTRKLNKFKKKIRMEMRKGSRHQMTESVLRK